MIIAVDTETTGVDLRHTSRPFFVTIADERGDVSFWEWDVDPETRKVDVPRSDVAEIRRIIDKADLVVMHNSKFDVRALETIGIFVDWSKIVDTLLAGHLLASNQPHDLTYMVMHYLGVSIKGLEEDLARCTKKARIQAKRLHWAIAKEDMEGMPSVSGGSSRDADKPWRNDTWVPRALAKHNKLSDNHEYWSVLQDYANADSLSTIRLWEAIEGKLKSRKLEKIWKERLKLLPVVYGIETRGLTLSVERMRELQDKFTDTLESTERILHGIARSYNYDLEIPKGNRNDSLQNFIYGKKGLNLDPIAKTETGKPSMAAKVLEQYLYILPDRSKHKKFIKCLTDRAKVSTALNYLDSYERFCLTCNYGDAWRVLYSSFNITGTHTLRFTSYNPSSQVISKREGFNLRYAFGPKPGREWWSIDASNIELRLPAYEAGEEEMIALFERPDDPPYFGSNHLLVSHILHPKEFEECVDENGRLDGRIFKKRYASTLYQWVKNGNFAVQYGAIPESGTADRAYHVAGGQVKVQARFRKIKQLNDRMIAFAEKYGYVETIPDKTVDPERGYPVFCTRTQWGKILPTVPLNYHIQSTAMWWMMKAMNRCHQFFVDNDLLGSHYIVAQIHDELIFDFPSGKGGNKEEPWRMNLPIIAEIRRLMMQGGDDIGIPTPVNIEYHKVHWGEGMTIPSKLFTGA